MAGVRSSAANRALRVSGESPSCTASLVPDARRYSEVAMQLAPLRIVLEPRAEPRPFMEQRLMRDLGRPLSDDDEAGVGEDVQSMGRVRVSIQIELRERSSTTDDLSG